MIIYQELNFNIIEQILDNAEVIRTANKSKKVTSTLNLACSFDIETTSMKIQDEKVAFMYVWMFAIEDISIYGRTWGEFKELIFKICKYARLGKDRILPVYIQNMGYEFQFIRKLFEWDSVFSVSERKPIKARTFLGIEFKDSYILSGYSLAKIGENLTSHTIKKLTGNLDYTLIRTPDTVLTPEELAYCENDVLILVYYIREQIQEFGNVTKIPLTNTGRVRKFVKDKCYFTNKNHKKSSQGKFRRYRNLMQELQLDLGTYGQLKRAFQGGFTHANANKTNKVIENVASFDFTSSYPASMLSEMYPMSSPVFMDNLTPEQFKECRKNMNLVFDVEIENLESFFHDENYLSESKCSELEKAVINNGRIFQAKHLKTTITEIDMDIMEKCYTWGSFKISNVTGFYKSYLPKPIIESILELYQNKTELKGVKGNEVEYMRSKGMLNSIYGMSVTDIIRTETVYKNDIWTSSVPDFGKEIGKYNNSKNRFLYYPWGIFVTAYSRRNLWTGIINLGSDYCYSDTDSIKVEHYEKHLDYIERYNKQVTDKMLKMVEFHGLDASLLSPKTIKGVSKPIGVWDFEGVYSRFKTLGAKRYMVEENGELAITVAGLSKRNGLEYMEEICNHDNSKVFELFNDELFIPANRTGKNTHTYIDKEFSFRVQDFQGHDSNIEVSSGVHLESAEFTLSISKQYGHFLKNYIQGYIYKGVEQRL